MKKKPVLALIFLIAVVLTAGFSAASQVAYIHLKNRAANSKTFTTANENVLAELKNAFIAANAKIVQEDSLQFTAELPNSLWAWERKDGEPDNPKAIVVINKKYDIGANQVKKPKSVTTIWVASIAADKKSYSIKLQDVLSIYPGNTKTNTGYTTGLFEDKIAGLVK